MAPVAKRNFSRRHDHGMSKNKGANATRDEEEDEDEDETLEEIETTRVDKALMSNPVNPPQTLKRSKELSSEDDGNKRQRLETDPTSSTESKDDDPGGGGVSSKRMSMWNSLLDKRPRSKDPKELSSWLNEVLTVSDLEFPLDQVGTDINHPYGKLLFSDLPKLSVPAVTPTEDEAGDSSGAADNLDTSVTNSNASTTTPDSSSKNNSINNPTRDTNITENVVGTKKTPMTCPKEPNVMDDNEDIPPISSKGMEESETENAVETAKNKKSETSMSVEEASSSLTAPETKESQTSTITNGIGTSNVSSKTKNNSKGVKLLGKKAKFTLKKSIIANEENQRKKEDEGFAGSFADWRDRKKGKLLKKGSGSLRK